ncbi:MAG: long-chain-fatty-acyl-CoA reductase [Acidimicrobiia bacterium]|nr:long-chain-fatty-acyl-CoA reductase [Acidimicrobiia bacterium]
MSGSIETRVSIPHVIKGIVHTDASVEYPASDGQPFATPRLDLDELVWPRTEPLPAAHLPVAEIIDVLVATGEQLRRDPGGLLAEALEALVRTSPYERRILEHSYNDLWRMFSGDRLWTQLNNELGGADVVDGWRSMPGVDGTSGAVRAAPTRIVHVLAGNAPGVAAMTVARGALMKGVHLLKMPSNDLLSATAVLRALGDVAPDHPVTRSFSAVYWRGGDAAVEGVLFRPQFFDKLVAWGGDSAIRSAAKYLGPGFELISFDPKNSISMIGREVFDSEETTASVAALAAADSVAYNQEACTSSRFHFVEGTHEQVDRYCAVLADEMTKERRTTSAKVSPMPSDIREEVAALRTLEPLYRVFGSDNGTGLVIRSDEPVEFFPSNKTVNVVAVASLDDALRYINVATQTVSIYPPLRKRALRDTLASTGVQRVVPVGGSAAMPPGLAHDGFFPLQRFVRWVNDEG